MALWGSGTFYIFALSYETISTYKNAIYRRLFSVLQITGGKNTEGVRVRVYVDQAFFGHFFEFEEVMKLRKP